MRTDPSTGATTILAGTPGASSCTDGSTGATSGVSDVEGITADGTNLYTVGACGVRVIDLSTGATHTIDIGGTPPASYTNLYSAVTLASSGGQSWLFATDNWDAQIAKINPATGATSVFYTYTDPPCCGASSDSLFGITSDSNNLYVPIRAGGTGPNLVTSVSLADGSRGSIAIATDSGPLTSIGGYLYAVAYNHSCGNFEVCGQSRGSHIAQISKADGSTTWLAGAGIGHQNGTGTQAWFTSITGITTDGTRLFVSDGGANRVRVAVAASPLPASESPYDNSAIPVAYGKAATLAGNTTTTSTTTPGAGTAASFYSPSGLTVIGHTAYVGVGDGISKVDLTNGTVSMFAGQPGNPGDTDALTGSAAQLSAYSLTTDGTYLYSTNGTEIHRTDVTTGATNILSESGLDNGTLAFGADGYLYEGGDSTAVRRFDPVTGAEADVWTPPSGRASNVDDVVGIAADASGLWIAHDQVGELNGPEDLHLAHVSYAGETSPIGKSTPPSLFSRWASCLPVTRSTSPGPRRRVTEPQSPRCYTALSSRPARSAPSPAGIAPASTTDVDGVGGSGVHSGKSHGK